MQQIPARYAERSKKPSLHLQNDSLLCAQLVCLALHRSQLLCVRSFWSAVTFLVPLSMFLLWLWRSLKERETSDYKT